jgi:cytochrome c5
MSARAMGRRVAWIVAITTAMGLVIWAAGSSGVSAQAGTAPAAPKKVAAAKPAGASAATVARGKYLVEISGCHDCHTSLTCRSCFQDTRPAWLCRRRPR